MFFKKQSAGADWLVAGLGNPGKKYEGTRHNAGFDALDFIAGRWNAPTPRVKFEGLLAQTAVNGHKVILLKPQTFMNLSGEAVQPLMAFYKIGVDDLLVVYDDMALPPGSIRLRPSGSSGSHKGMQNIIDRLGSEKIKRIRVGIGEPPHGGADYVLSKPSGEEKRLLELAKQEAGLAIRDYLLHGFPFAMNAHNQGKKSAG